jgi:hypothetical protein
MTEPLEDVLSVSREVQKFSVETLTAVFGLATGRRLSQLFVAPALILSRMLGHHAAINFLLEECFVIEAGTLALTQLELCLDVVYIGADVDRAREWIDHDSAHHAPWGVRNKIEDVFSSDPSERNAKLKLFELLSSLKHGNPAVGGLAFGMRRDGNRFVVTTDQVDDYASKQLAITVAGGCAILLLEAPRSACEAFTQFVSVEPAAVLAVDDLVGRCRRETARSLRELDRLEKASALH